MKILVTGATGFIGSHLTRKLVEEGHSVEIIVRKESPVERLQKVKEKIRIHLYEESLESMENIFKKARPEQVIHLASYFVAEHSPGDLEPMVRGNLLFPLHLLEAMSRQGVSSLLTTATFWQHYRHEKYSPASLYAATKQAFEDILLFYVGAKKMRALILTLYDTYGPGDFRPKLFNRLRKAAEEKSVLNMSPGEQKLDLVYIDDCVEGFLSAANCLSDFSEGALQKFALASGVPVSLKEVVATYEKVLGIKLKIGWGEKPYRGREMMRPWVVDPILPGWRPRTTLIQGIRKMEEGQ